MTPPFRGITPTLSTLAAVCALTLPAPELQAQSQSILALLPADGRALAMGEEVSGGLSASDLLGPNGERMEAWTFEGTAGQSVTFDLRSDEFDAVLHVVGPGLGQGLRDDDGGAGCDARLEVTFLESGTHTVVASSTFADETGVYTLRVGAEVEPIVEYPCGGANPAVLMDLPTDPSRTLSPGASASGALDGSENPIENGRPGQAWTLEGVAGERVTLRLLSDDFDPYLYALGPGLDVLSDDDGGGGRNSQLDIELPETGTYRVVVSSFGDTGRGSFTIEVAPPVDLSDLPVEGRLTIGAVSSGSLSNTALPVYDGRPAQVWELNGEAGQAVTVELRSEAFDPYLYIMGPGLAEPLENDDGAGDLDSRIELVFPETGSYRIVVSAYAFGSSGEFDLEVSADP